MVCYKSTWIVEILSINECFVWLFYIMILYVIMQYFVLNEENEIETIGRTQKVKCEQFREVFKCIHAYKWIGDYIYGSMTVHRLHRCTALFEFFYYLCNLFIFNLYIHFPCAACALVVNWFWLKPYCTSNNPCVMY